MSRLIQSVIIKFADGRTGVFSGPAIINTEELSIVKITNITLGPPRKLPDDYSFEEIKLIEGVKDENNI